MKAVYSPFKTLLNAATVIGVGVVELWPITVNLRVGLERFWNGIRLKDSVCTVQFILLPFAYAPNPNEVGKATSEALTLPIEPFVRFAESSCIVGPLK